MNELKMFKKAIELSIYLDDLIALLKVIDGKSNLELWEYVIMQFNQSQEEKTPLSSPKKAINEENLIEIMMGCIGPMNTIDILLRYPHLCESLPSDFFEKFVVEELKNQQKQDLVHSMLEAVDGYLWVRRANLMAPSLRHVKDVETNEYLIKKLGSDPSKKTRLTDLPYLVFPSKPTSSLTLQSSLPILAFDQTIIATSSSNPNSSSSFSSTSSVSMATINSTLDLTNFNPNLYSIPTHLTEIGLTSSPSISSNMGNLNLYNTSNSSGYPRYLEEPDIQWGASSEVTNGCCPVCTLPLIEKVSNVLSNVVVMECGHVFHQPCLPEEVCVLCVCSEKDSLFDWITQPL